MSRYDGNLDVFDVASRTKLVTWDVGSSLGGLSVSEDGGFLLVVERFSPPFLPGGPPPQPGPPPSSTFYRVDTATGAVTTYTRAGGAYLDVEIVDGDTAILTGGQQEVSTFDLATGSYQTLQGAGNNAVLVEDEHYTLFAVGGVSDGPLMLFDDRTGTIVAQGNNYQTIGAGSGQTGFNFGHQAISEAAGLVAQFVYHSTVNLFDLNLHFIRGFSITGPVDGLAFDTTGKFLFARTGQQLNQIDIATGAVVDSFSVAAANWHNNMGSGDQIVLSEDGKIILVKDNSTGQLQLIDLRIRDEVFEGTAGGDAFAGGKGDDTYVVNHAGDTIAELLYDGIDLAVSSIDYTIQPYVENLTLAGAASRGTGNGLANRIEGTDGANLLQGMDGDDSLFGLAGADLLDGGLGVDRLEGGQGDDVYFADAGDAVIEAVGEGYDIVYAGTSYVLSAGTSVEVLATIDNTATTALNLTGNALDNYLVGNAGANTLDGGSGGADQLWGREGDDSYFVDSNDAVVEYAGDGDDIVYARSSYALGVGMAVELLGTVDGNATTAINLFGNAFDNYLTGNAGANTLDGGGGSDTLSGGSGDDSYFADAGDTVVEYAGQGYDILYASSDYTLVAGLSIEVLGTVDNNATTALRLTGNELANYIVGNAGVNTLDGGSGGADQLWGREGDDSYFVDGNDAVVEYAGHGYDIVYARSHYALGVGMAVEVLGTVDNTATTAINLIGNALDNYITGNAGANTLHGGGGSDVLWGREGDDSYFADAGDVVIEYAGQGNDILYAGSDYTLVAGLSIEVLGTADNNAATALRLTGNELSNYVTGNAGANVIDGGLGADSLQGRGGNDTFAFTTALGGGNVDAILDFMNGADKIALDDAVFAGLGARRARSRAFVAGSTAQEADDRILYDPQSGALYFDADGSGAGAAIQFATVTLGTGLSASDFMVI